jgi:hypothetical protein
VLEALRRVQNGHRGNRSSVKHCSNACGQGRSGSRTDICTEIGLVCNRGLSGIGFRIRDLVRVWAKSRPLRPFTSEGRGALPVLVPEGKRRKKNRSISMSALEQRKPKSIERVKPARLAVRTLANGSPQRHPVGQCRTAVARAWHHASGAVSAVRHLRGSDADDKLLILSGMLPTEGHGAKFIGRRRHSRRTALMRPLPSLGKKGKGI